MRRDESGSELTASSSISALLKGRRCWRDWASPGFLKKRPDMIVDQQWLLNGVMSGFSNV